MGEIGPMRSEMNPLPWHRVRSPLQADIWGCSLKPPLSSLKALITFLSYTKRVYPYLFFLPVSTPCIIATLSPKIKKTGNLENSFHTSFKTKTNNTDHVP